MFIPVLAAGILQHPDGTVLKQLQPPPRGPREMQFYTKVMETKSHKHIHTHTHAHAHMHSRGGVRWTLSTSDMQRFYITMCVTVH